MKYLITFLLILLALVSSTLAHYQCGNYLCPFGSSCICDNGVFHCVYRCEEVFIFQNITNRWVDGQNDPSVQVSVEIINHTHREIKDIIIATDVRLNSNQIWGVDKCEFANGITLIDLPSYITLQPFKSYTFGYINKGNHAANLYAAKIFIKQ